MAAAADRKTFVLAVLGAALAFTLGRFPLASATSGLWLVTIAAGSFLLLGLPLFTAEAALGQYRRRNVVDALGPGAWRGAGFLFVGGAVLAAALLSVLAGWSGRYVVDSFQGDWFGSPDRHFRLLAAGPDALVAVLAVVVAVTLIAWRSAGRGARGLAGACAVTSLLLLAGLATWANLQSGSGAGRSALFAWDGSGMTASGIMAAILAGLLPALLATGVVATSSAWVQGRGLPREAAMLAITILLALSAALLFLAALASSHGRTLSGGLLATYSTIPSLFASVGGTTGGVLTGCFFGAILLSCLAGLLALFEVVSTWLAEAYPSWTPGRAALAAGLLAYVVAIPFCFSASSVAHLDDFLAWVAAPLAGLLLCLHVGWARPEVLEGFKVGEARHPLDAGLRPVLRFVAPSLLVVLLIAGLLGFVRAVGWMHGSGGLWALAP